MADINVPERVNELSEVMAEKYNLDKGLILSICYHESGFREKALGDHDRNGIPHSFGIMQLYDKGAGYGHKKEDLLKLEYNMNVGCNYLKACLDAFPDDFERGVLAYNRGIGGARKVADPKTYSYTKNVMALYKRFSEDKYKTVATEKEVFAKVYKADISGTLTITISEKFDK